MSLCFIFCIKSENKTHTLIYTFCLNCLSVQIMVVKLRVKNLVFVDGCDSEVELETDEGETEGDDSILEQLRPA